MKPNLREIGRAEYDARGYTNEESLANLQVTSPTMINMMLTYNYGKDSDTFPLSFLTEGQGKKGVKTVDNVQWTWKTMGRLDFTDCVTYFNTAETSPGYGGTAIEVHFSSHRFIEQYGLTAPDGVTKFRIQKDLGTTAYGYGYIIRPTNLGATDSIDPSLFEVGKYWAMTAPTVSESYSKGNRSNALGWGTMTSQLEISRYSKEIAGNVSNVTVKYEMEYNGKKAKYWILEEMRQYEHTKRIMKEERLWSAEYNRDADGKIHLLDEENGQPIPHTAGMIEICKEANYDSYGYFLSLQKIKSLIRDVTENDDQNGNKTLVIIGGTGFCDDFDMAIRMDSVSNGFFTPLGDAMINETASGLSYGKYFRRYTDISGNTIIVKRGNYFDSSTTAEMDKRNGNLHPRTKRPLSSHRACMIDSSTYNGENNITLTKLKGQEHIVKVIEGMTPIPKCWGLDSNKASTDVDKSRYEEKFSIGLQVNKATNMAYIECVL